MATVNATTTVGGPSMLSTLADNWNNIGTATTNTAAAYMNSASSQLAGGYNTALGTMSSGYNAVTGALAGPTTTVTTTVQNAANALGTGASSLGYGVTAPSVQISTTPLGGATVMTNVGGSQLGGFGGTGMTQTFGAANTATSGIGFPINTNVTPTYTSGINMAPATTTIVTDTMPTTYTSGVMPLTTNYSSGVTPIATATSNTGYNTGGFTTTNYTGSGVTQPLITTDVYKTTTTSSVGGYGAGFGPGSTDGKYILSTTNVPSTNTQSASYFTNTAMHPATYTTFTRVDEQKNNINDNFYTQPVRRTGCTTGQKICTALSLLGLIGLLAMLWCLFRKPKAEIESYPMYNPANTLTTTKVTNITTQTTVPQNTLKPGIFVVNRPEVPVSSVNIVGLNDNINPNTKIPATVIVPPVTATTVTTFASQQQGSSTVTTKPVTTTVVQPANSTIVVIPPKPQPAPVVGIYRPGGATTTQTTTVNPVNTATATQTTTTQPQTLTTTEQITTTQNNPGPIYITYSSTMSAGLHKIFNPKTQTYIYINNFPPGSQGYIQKFGTGRTAAGAFTTYSPSSAGSTTQTTTSYNTAGIAWPGLTAAANGYAYPQGSGYSVQVPTSYAVTRTLEEPSAFAAQSAGESVL